MKLMVLFAGVSLAVAQPATTAKQPLKPKTQNAKDCSVNIYGSNNSVGNLTCIGIDAGLAKEFKEIANGTNRDAKLLTDIKTKLQALVDQVKRSGPTVQAGAGSVISISQSGGITAGQVNISGSSAAELYFSAVSANQPEVQRDGSTLYKTELRVSLTGMVPEFTVAVSAPSLARFHMAPDHSAITMERSSAVENGSGWVTIQNAFGTFILTVFSESPERFQISYLCTGATCVRP